MAKLGRSLREKPLEWLFALILFTWGLRMTGTPFLSTARSFSTLASLADQQTWAVICLTLGGLRMMVLIINGAWRASPHARAALSLSSLLFWLCVVWGFVTAGSMGTALTVYPWVALFEFSVGWRTVVEAGKADRGAKAWKRRLLESQHGSPRPGPSSPPG